MFEPLGANGKKPARPGRPSPAIAPRAKGKTPAPAAVAKGREPLLSAQIQAEASVAGSLAAQQANLQSAGACLKEPVRFSAAPNGLNGLAADLAHLFDNFQLLAGDPSNLPVRHAVVRSAQAVAVQLNHAASRLNAVKIDLNASIQGDVDQVNQHLAAIAGMNRKIVEARANRGRIGALADEREQSLEALAGCIAITVAPCASGAVKVSIAGVTMVAGAERCDALATYRDRNGNLGVLAEDARKRLKPAGGSIAGKITARDGGLAGLQRGLDNLAAQLISRVNTIYNSAHSKGAMNHDFFTGSVASDIGVNSIVANDPAQLQAGADGNGKLAGDLAQLGDRHVSVLGNRTFCQWYAQTVAALGDTISSVNDSLISSQVVARMLANERGATFDLSPHDAADDLMWYQQARAASARLVTMLDQMPPMGGV